MPASTRPKNVPPSKGESTPILMGSREAASGTVSEVEGSPVTP
jgi:hypothetical protein